MNINSITVSNFQSYYGEQTLEFADGLNLIIGNGGTGKSKLFNAFYWALFGKIYITSEGWCNTANLFQDSNKALHNYEFINKKALYEAKIDGLVTCSVIIDITDDRNKNYIIERQASVVRQPIKAWDTNDSWSSPVFSLKVTRDTITGTKPEVGIMADSIISDLFPEEIRDYIWFQGESLEALIDFRNKENLRHAVQHISYFPYYEKMTKIIDIAKNKISRDEVKKLQYLNSKNAEAKSLISKIKILRERIQSEEEKKKQYSSNIEKIQFSLADDKSKMEGIAGYAQIVREDDECDKEIIRLNNSLTELDKEQRELLPSLWILRGAEKLIEHSKSIIESHVQEEATLPEKKYIDEPSRSKLEQILNNDHRCFVCGSPVDEAHPHAVEWIMKRLRMQEEYYDELENFRKNMEFSKQFNMFVGKIQDYPDYLIRSVKNIDKRYEQIEDEIDKLIRKRRLQHDKKAELDKKIEDIKRKHGIDPRKEAGNLNRLSGNIKISETELVKQKKLLDTCNNAIRQYNEDLHIAESKLGDETEAGKITTVPQTEWKNITLFLEPICQIVKERARKELIRNIQDRANDIYDKFTEHDKGYKGRVEINDDYAITFDAGLNTSHEDRKKMSIINALLSLNQEKMGCYYPFISDAPTSSFDLSTTHKYLMGIKDIFHQTIIMTKDVEIGSDKYKSLINEHKVSRVFELSSKSYRSDSIKPEIWEVSTIVNELK